MYVDIKAAFSLNQEIGANSTDADSEHIIDLGPLGGQNTLDQTNIVPRDLGAGQDLYLVVGMRTDTALGAAVTIKISQDARLNDAGNALRTPATADDVTVGTLSATAIDQGTGANVGHLILRLAPGQIKQRYLRLQYDKAGATVNAAFDAFITADINAYTVYQKGYNVG